MDLKKIIRDIPDFPKPGIMFRDITTLLMDAGAYAYSIDEMARLLDGYDYTLILGPESRGFIFGAPLAYKLGKGFIPVRKAGKLPHEVIKKDYALEYGNATIEIHKDAIKPGQRVLVADDLLATGGTSKAIVDMVKEVGGIVAALVFMIELTDLKGRDALSGENVLSLVKY